jgi:hypothetical protein
VFLDRLGHRLDGVGNIDVVQPLESAADDESVGVVEQVDQRYVSVGLELVGDRGVAGMHALADRLRRFRAHAPTIVTQERREALDGVGALDGAQDSHRMHQQVGVGFAGHVLGRQTA